MSMLRLNLSPRAASKAQHAVFPTQSRFHCWTLSGAGHTHARQLPQPKTCRQERLAWTSRSCTQIPQLFDYPHVHSMYASFRSVCRSCMHPPLHTTSHKCTYSFREMLHPQACIRTDRHTIPLMYMMFTTACHNQQHIGVRKLFISCRNTLPNMWCARPVIMCSVCGKILKANDAHLPSE